MASCSSTKLAKKAPLVGNLSEAEYVEQALSYHLSNDWKALTAKMSLTLQLGEKDATKVNGTLRIKKGEVIQLSVAPVLGIEVARAEISPEGVLVIDRLHKRYVRVSFEELQTLLKTDLNFHILQALFLNELFLPGKADLTVRDGSDFSAEVVSEGVMLDVKKAKRFSYQFLTQAPEALLKESRIGLQGTEYGLVWKYDKFRSLENKLFPSYMQLSLEGGKKASNATFALSRLSTNSDWEAHTTVSAKYEKVELEDLVKQLLKK